MQNLACRIDQLVNMQKPKENAGSIPQSVLIGRVISKNQEILCATASKIYSIHDMVSTMANVMGLENLTPTERMSENQQNNARVRLAELQSDAWTYASFPGQSLTLNSDHASSSCMENPFFNSDTGPPPLEPVNGVSTFLASGNSCEFPLAGLAKNLPPRIDNRRMEHIVIPDLTTLRFEQKNLNTQQQMHSILQKQDLIESPHTIILPSAEICIDDKCLKLKTER
ncbi:hypothetical protein BIW11_05782 [Tropilaelaps mercedesae]|uniref:Uncharacterized protein n=2 Tax=Tropilaelaps mercedesae TaxID=418985 RepID=A0A1V9Y0V7_9ACAR|nr:hypothetical protein BIW11_05782 [Tropilaelaps mercedesae]